MTDPPIQPSRGERQLLDREPPSGYLDEWAGRLASGRVDAERGANSVIVFRIGLEWLALPTAVFQEVAEHSVLHTIPHRRGGVLTGLANIRGELMLCASLGVLLDLEQDAHARTDDKRLIYDRLLVTNRDGDRLGFPVDQVHGIVRYHPRELEIPPATLKKSATFTLGLLQWQERTVGCLDGDLLFYKLNKSLS